MYSLADRISLKVPDIDTFIENLNSVGYLLKKGPKTYQVPYDGILILISIGVSLKLYSLLGCVFLSVCCVL